MIYVASMAFGSEKWLFESALEFIKKADCVVLQSENIAGAEFIKNLNENVRSLDEFYEQNEEFEALYEKGGKFVCQKEGDVVFVALGEIKNNGFVKKIKEKKQIKALPCVDETAVCLQKAAEFFDVGDYKSAAACNIEDIDIDGMFDLVITNIDSVYCLAEVKLYLTDFYRDIDVLFVNEFGAEKMSLYDLDKVTQTGIGAALYVPKPTDEQKERYTFYDLIKIMRRLRGKNGCPWDAEQTHRTLTQCLIEEAYETAEAIEKDDIYAMYDELGDVLLQVVFHGQIAKECGEFDLNDITDAICSKLILRHPHIFGNVNADNADKVMENWEQIKKKEKGFKTYTQSMRDIPSGLSALIKSAKIQKKAKAVGFDFGDVKTAFEKVKEETGELEKAIEGGENIKEEAGDLLFSVVNVLRLAKEDPEIALIATNEKFIKRFEYVEKNTKGDLKDSSTQEMDRLWEESKTGK